MEKRSFKFKGKGSEYFLIWIVNLALTLLSLGIYSAWATVRKRRYFYANTWVGDSNFEYHAQPIQILKGRAIAVALFLGITFLSELFPSAGMVSFILLALITPWLIWKSLSFRARMSSYRNVRFSFESQFQDAFKELFLKPAVPVVLIGIITFFVLAFSGISPGMAIGLTLSLGFFSLYLVAPYIHVLYTRYYLNHTHYGNASFSAHLSTRVYILTYLKLWGILLLLMAFLALLGYVIISSNPQIMSKLMPDFGPDGSAQTQPFKIPSMAYVFIALAYVVFLVIGLISRAYLKARLNNYMYQQAIMDNEVKFRSTLHATDLMWIYTSNLLLIIFTLGLAFPWTSVRLAKYQASHLNLFVREGGLVNYIDRVTPEESALGDEVGDAFNIDGIDIGL